MASITFNAVIDENDDLHNNYEFIDMKKDYW